MFSREPHAFLFGEARPGCLGPHVGPKQAWSDYTPLKPCPDDLLIQIARMGGCSRHPNETDLSWAYEAEESIHVCRDPHEIADGRHIYRNLAS
jgi:hypothetical protein